MSDGLSVAASVLGITSAALQSVQYLSRTIDNIKGVPDVIKTIKVDLNAVEPVLRQLDSALQGNASQILLAGEINSAVENCSRACTAFETQLGRWMRYSTEEKTFWVDRWRVGLFGQERIRTFKGQLNDCKGTLSVALNTAGVLTMTRQGCLMEEMKDMVLRQNEEMLQQNITQADSQRTAIESSLRQFSASDSTQLSEELERNKQELLRELQQQKISNDTLKKMCEEALSGTVYERTGQKIRGVKATNNSSAWAGFYNTSKEESNIDQDISDITADNQSIAAAGVFRDIDFKDFRPSTFRNSVGNDQL